jgi:hypothetical protein
MPTPHSFLAAAGAARKHRVLRTLTALAFVVATVLLGGPADAQVTYRSTVLGQTRWLGIGADQFDPAGDPTSTINALTNGVSDNDEWLGQTQFLGNENYLTATAILRGSTVFHPFGTNTYSVPVAMNRRGTVLSAGYREGQPGVDTLFYFSVLDPPRTIPDRRPAALNDRDDILLTNEVSPNAGATRVWIQLGAETEVELTALTNAYPAVLFPHFNDNRDVVGFVGEPIPSTPFFRPTRKVFLLRHNETNPIIIGEDFEPTDRIYVTNRQQVVVSHPSPNNWGPTYLWDAGQWTLLSPNGRGSWVKDFNNSGDFLLRVEQIGWMLYRGGRFIDVNSILQLHPSTGWSTSLTGLGDSGAIFGTDFVDCGVPGAVPPTCHKRYFRADPMETQSFTLQGLVVGARVDLTWAVPVGVAPTSYRIEAAAAPGGPPLVAIDRDATATAFSTIAPPGTYYVRMLAQSSGQTLATSNEVVLVVASPRTCTTPPLPPTGLRASVLGYSTTLGWNPSEGATSYHLLATFGSTLIAFSTGNTLTEYHTPSPPGRYFVRLAADNTCGRSALTPILEVVVGCTPPTPPTLTGSVSPTGVVSLAWDAPVGNVNSITAGSRPGATDVAQFVVYGSTFAGSPPAGTYYVRLRTENICGQSALSSELSLRVGGP